MGSTREEIGGGHSSPQVAGSRKLGIREQLELGSGWNRLDV